MFGRKRHWCEEEEIVRNLIMGKVSEQLKWVVAKAARSAVKDYLQEVREAEIIAQKIRNGTYVSEGEMNEHNQFKAGGTQ